MRVLTPKEMIRVYHFTKGTLVAAGLFLIGYGGWDIINSFLLSQSGSHGWFGIFPCYVGAMLILISLAMKEDWFTNARRYW
jgi:hypothetical protein